MSAKLFYFSEPTERELLTLVREDDRQAFAALYEKYWQSLYNAAYKRLEDAAACEEIIQDLFVHFYESRKQIDVRISLSGYLHTALKHRILNHLRSRQRRKWHTAGAAGLIPAADNSTKETVELNALKRAVDLCLQKMPRKYREVYELNRQQHLPVREAAARLGISESLAEKHLARAIALLRGSLGEFLPAAVLFLLAGNH